MNRKPIPFDPSRRPRPLPQRPDHYTAILEEIAAISDRLDALADLVVRQAALDHRGRDG